MPRPSPRNVLRVLLCVPLRVWLPVPFRVWLPVPFRSVAARWVALALLACLALVVSDLRLIVEEAAGAPLARGRAIKAGPRNGALHARSD